MGGNALPNAFTRRFKVDEYLILRDEILEILSNCFGNSVPTFEVQAYASKDSFGDIDIIIESDLLPNDYQAILKQTFKPTEFVPNGPVVSFDYKELQVDLIKMPKSNFNTARHYYSFNDLGNLMGKISHQFGLKYGHDGLHYIMRNGGKGRKDICLSKNPREIFETLGFNYNRYLEGFNTLEDIFDFVISSKHFNPEIFLFENLNHDGRTRDRKRATYAAFVKVCEKLKKDGGEFYEFEKDKTSYLPSLFDQYPNFEDAFIANFKDELVNEIYKKRFNGSVVASVTGLEGPELGEFMKQYKPLFTMGFVLSQNEDQISNYINHCYESFKNV